MTETPLTAILKLMEHCSDAECMEIQHACLVKVYGKTTNHDGSEPESVPLDWKPGVHADNFGPEHQHTPTGGQLPPSSMDETINRGRFK